MVRINLIQPKYLSDQHLLAEHTEILMLCSYIKRYPKIDGSEPINYTLGKGHIKFFKDKILYLRKRFLYIQKEMIERGYIVKANFMDFSNNEYDSNCNFYTPTEEALQIIKERIKERLFKKLNWYTYYGCCLTKEEWERKIQEAN
jgi:deoxyribonuclease (pyrimidine dimer)